MNPIRCVDKRLVYQFFAMIFNWWCPMERFLRQITAAENEPLVYFLFKIVDMLFIIPSFRKGDFEIPSQNFRFTS